MNNNRNLLYKLRDHKNIVHYVNPKNSELHITLCDNDPNTENVALPLVSDFNKITCKKCEELYNLL